MSKNLIKNSNVIDCNMHVFIPLNAKQIAGHIGLSHLSSDAPLIILVLIQQRGRKHIDGRAL